jgi:Amt family ammonium transporter
MPEITAPINMELSWTLTCAVLVFLMQAGFCLLESGMVRTKNSINVAVKNLLDSVVAISLFCVCGFSMMFGADYLGFIGVPGSVEFWLDPRLTTFCLFQLMFCSTAATIVSGAVAERMQLKGYVITAAIVSGLVYPICGHWVWGGTLPGTSPGWLASLGFVDFAGATTVHVVGGFAALAACIAVGPRRSFRKSTAISGHSLPLTVLGCFLLWFGWWGFNGGSGLAINDNLPRILLNTQLGAAFGGLTAAIICIYRHKRVEVVPLICGILAGLVSVTGACHVLSPLSAAVSGVVGVFVCVLATEWLLKKGIDDVAGAFPVHGAAGIWGSLVFALFGPESELPGTRMYGLLVQLVGSLSVALFAFGVTFGALKLIRRFWRLRVRAGEEHRGLNMVEHGATNEVIDLLTEMHQHRKTGDYSRKVAVEQFTEAGQIASEYNRVIRRVDEEVRSHKETNAGLNLERLRLQSVLQHVGVGIYQLSPERRFTSVNPMLVQTLGYSSAAELLDLEPISVTPWLDGTANAEAYEAALCTESAIRNLETRIKDANGDETWLLESLVPIRDDSGRLIVWLGTVHDVTVQKQAMLAEVEIAQAKSQAKGEFLANMSHEIRTPLNGVIGMLDLLGGQDLTEQSSHYVSIARSSANTLLALINDILDFSKIEAGHMEIEEIDFELRESVENTAEQFAIRAHMQKLELNCDVSSSLPYKVVGDPERLRQVLINLLANALKFTPEGEINLRVAPTKKGIRFSVEDTGIGMTKEQCSRMFDAFTQADPSTTREYGGTGLGLAIGSHLVSQMGGQLCVDSVVGHGSTFYFDLPLKTSEAKAPSEVQMQELMDTLPQMRVLIIDDNETNCEILQTQLAAWGFNASICKSAELAAERLLIAEQSGRPFNLVLLDYCMPVMDGREVALQIRTHHQFRDLPIIMLSSNHELLSPSERETCGINIAMTKPVRQSRLFDSIMSLVQARITNKQQPRANQPISSSSTVSSSVLTAALPAASVPVPPTPAAANIQQKQEPAIGPAATGPAATGPAATGPAATGPAATGSAADGPGTMNPIASQIQPVENPSADVLVVEDNYVNQIVVQRMLESIGVTSDVAQNGREAVNKVQLTAYSLILMDGHMPVLDGLAATQEIRELEQAGPLAGGLSRIPIVALTANAVRGVREKCLAVGMDDYLCKPVTLEQLKAITGQYVPELDAAGSQPAPLPTAPEQQPAAAEVPAVQPVQPTTNPAAVEDGTANKILESINSVQSLVTKSLDGEELQLLDQEELDRRCSGDKNFQKMLLQIMHESLPGSVTELRSLDIKSFSQIEKAAHRLKGAAGDCSLRAVYDGASRLEQAAKTRNEVAIGETMNQLESRVTTTLVLLDHLMKDDSPVANA